MYRAAGPETILSERYDIAHDEPIERIGHCAAIFAAYGQEKATGREVFMKVKDRDPVGHAQLRTNNEANHLESLNHPQIPRLVEAQPFAEYPYIVTERMPGNAQVARWLKNNEDYETVAKVGLSALNVLSHIHEQKTIHRDVKEANLVMQWGGEVALIDFELALNDKQRQRRQERPARDDDLPTDARITGAGKMVCTVTHGAPEQLKGKEATEQSDLYALGIVLYRLAYGRVAFPGVTTKEVANRRMIEDIDYWPAGGRWVPDKLRFIIERATQENPAERYQSAGEMAEDLERWARDYAPIVPASEPLAVAA